MCFGYVDVMCVFVGVWVFECLCACALDQTGARSADDKSALRGE